MGFALLTVLAGCGESAQPVAPVEQFESAMAALDGGDPVEAEQLLAAMVEDDPTDPVARAGLARSQARQSRYGEAIVHDKLALAADPRLAEVAYNLACSYAALGDTDESLRWLSRAWNGGIRDLNLIEQDVDLAPLRQDHRFAFFLATGALSLREEEAYVRITPTMARPGDEIRVELVVVSLNRPLMTTPETLTVDFGGELPAAALEPVSRIELFEAGEIGGREYFRRFITYSFTARSSVETLLGPFDLALGETPIPVRPAWLSVQDVLPDLFPRDRATGTSSPAPSAADWFESPGTLTDEAHPFARWEPNDDGALDLVVGVTLFTDGLEVPPGLALEIASCGTWLYPRQTAFLRTRAEGGSRVWFHRRWDPTSAPAACPDPAGVRVALGDEILYEAEVAWPRPPGG